LYLLISQGRLDILGSPADGGLQDRHHEFR
jgi:hypothetical protein